MGGGREFILARSGWGEGTPDRSGQGTQSGEGVPQPGQDGGTQPGQERGVPKPGQLGGILATDEVTAIQGWSTPPSIDRVPPVLGWGTLSIDGVPPCPGWGTPLQRWGTPWDRTADGVLDTRRAVCLLRSRRRTVLLNQ